MPADKKPDPNPEHGKDDEHGHDPGRKPPITPSAPMPLKQLTELDFEFWHSITKR
jgi:hypothetical protein